MYVFLLITCFKVKVKSLLKRFNLPVELQAQLKSDSHLPKTIALIDWLKAL